jgi:hypothetical protein
MKILRVMFKVNNGENFVLSNDGAKKIVVGKDGELEVACATQVDLNQAIRDCFPFPWRAFFQEKDKDINNSVPVVNV